MKHLRRTPAARSLLALLLAVAGLALGGCSRAKLDLDPAIVTGCAAGHGEAILVRWDAGRHAPKGVRIFINRPGANEHLWTRGKPAGQRRTGRWGTDGLTFVLRNAQGAELARRTVESSRCPFKQKDE
jgi:hypothetical protein